MPSATLPRPGRAAAMLVLCSLCWGASFPLMPIAAAGLARATDRIAADAAVGAAVNAWRYAIAALLLALAILPRWRRLTRDELLGGIALGGCMGVGMLCQIQGLAWIVPSTSGMLSATPVILAPLAQACILRRPVSRRVALAATVAAMGCALLAFGGAAAQGEGSLVAAPPFPGAGELVTLLGACCFTGLILLVDRCGAKGADPARLSGVLFLTAAVLNAAVAVADGRFDGAAALLGDPAWIGPMLILTLVCTIGALWLMTRAQPALTPASAAVIYTLEPIFGTAFSLALGQERLTGWTVTGGCLVLAAAAAAVGRGRRRSPPQAAAPDASPTHSSGMP